MLMRIILLPSVVSTIPENQIGVYILTIKLLQELEKNGIILVDDRNSIKTALSEGISKWPEKFRIPAQKLLKQLWKKNRFVEVSLHEDLPIHCENKICQPCIKIAKEYLPLAVLARHVCNQCANKHLLELPIVKIVDIEEYAIDDYFRSKLDDRGCILSNGEWKQDKFEQEILIPLFRDAKHIKIYDRWIGRSILTPNGDKYKLTLEWIHKVFLEKSRLGLSGIFEIYTGCQSTADLSDTITALRQLEIEIQKIHANFKIIIKNENNKGQMPHDRYLITNQVAIAIDRGFDLILDNRNTNYPRRLRDLRIDYCNDPNKIEQIVRNLPNV